MFSAKARKSLTTARKSLATFDTIHFKRSVLEYRFDVKSSLQVESGNAFDSLAFDSDLQIMITSDRSTR